MGERDRPRMLTGRMGMGLAALAAGISGGMGRVFDGLTKPPTQKWNYGNRYQGSRVGIKPNHQSAVTGKSKPRSRVSSKASHHYAGYAKRAANRRAKGR